MDLDESKFHEVADRTLADLHGAIEDALGDRLDADLQDGILTLELDAGGEYVINKHAPNRQIWMSSPLSGATHYAYDGGAWVGTRDGASLLARLADELTGKTGVTIALG